MAERVSYFDSDVASETSFGKLDWSDELSLSAGWHTKDLSGCSVHHDYLVDVANPNTYIKQIAYFEDHARFAVYPERMQWANTKELAWDFIFQDGKVIDNVQRILDPEWTHIGVACSCHPVFEQYCIHTPMKIPGFDSGPKITHTLDFPTFKLAGDSTCENDRRDGYCGEKYTT